MADEQKIPVPMERPVVAELKQLDPNLWPPTAAANAAKDDDMPAKVYSAGDVDIVWLGPNGKLSIPDQEKVQAIIDVRDPLGSTEHCTGPYVLLPAPKDNLVSWPRVAGAIVLAFVRNGIRPLILGTPGNGLAMAAVLMASCQKTNWPLVAVVNQARSYGLPPNSIETAEVVLKGN